MLGISDRPMTADEEIDECAKAVLYEQKKRAGKNVLMLTIACVSFLVAALMFSFSREVALHQLAIAAFMASGFSGVAAVRHFLRSKNMSRRVKEGVFGALPQEAQMLSEYIARRHTAEGTPGPSGYEEKIERMQLLSDAILESKKIKGPEK